MRKDQVAARLAEMAKPREGVTVFPIKTPRPVICIVAASGAGKDTLVKALMDKYPERFHKFLSTTTRDMRPGEADGVDYHFITPEQFEQWKAEGRFILDTAFAGASYGTLGSEFEGDKTVLAIVVETTAQELQELMGARIVSITVDPETVKERMLARGDDPATVQKRLDADEPRRAAIDEVAQWTIENDDFDEALAKLDQACTEIEIKHGLRRDLPATPPSPDAPDAPGH